MKDYFYKSGDQGISLRDLSSKQLRLLNMDIKKELKTRLKNKDVEWVVDSQTNETKYIEEIAQT